MQSTNVNAEGTKVNAKGRREDEVPLSCYHIVGELSDSV